MDKDVPSDKTKKTSLFTRIKQAKELPPQDIIFDLTDSSLTLLLIIFSKAKLKVGYPSRWLRKLFFDIALLRSQYTFETYSHLDMLSILNAHTMTLPLEYQLSIKTTNKENPYILYFAGASMKNRCWSEENYGQLISKMAIEYPDYQHIILKGIKEDEKFDAIYAPNQHLSNVIHQDSLPLDKIYDYLAEASLVIVGDTGIRNMAIATHTPTLGIFFGLTPYKYWPRDNKHDCVFKPDLSVPNVDEVYDSAKNLIGKIYGK
jgi:ADP-heptose:LPS heptosyltransferase